MRTETRTPGRRQGTGFTLVELLTVIIIIGLLASILLPTVTSALRSGYVAKSLAQRKNLGDGAENYKQDHTGFYPGQEDVTLFGSYTGSQILASCLFDYDIAAPSPEPTGKYAAFKDEYLSKLDSKDRTLSDLFPKGKDMAFCYYPYRGATFQYSDNQVHTNPADGDSGKFSGFINDPRFGQPHNKGRFILIAPGGDRKYFTPDDIRNW